MAGLDGQRLAVFPLAGAVLFPGLHLPLHIFEARYQAMITEVMARDRLVGMIQPRPAIGLVKDGLPPPLFDRGCVGRVAEVEALDDGRYNLILQGVTRFTVLRELEVTTPFRQVQALLDPVSEEPEVLASIARADLEREAKRFAERQGYVVDWAAVSTLDDETLVNGIAQVAPFDVAAKQALLEAPGLSDRAELVVQLMQFFGMRDSDDGEATLQ